MTLVIDQPCIQWLKTIRQQNKAIKRKNKLIKRLRRKLKGVL